MEYKKGPTFRYGMIQIGYWMDYLIIASFAAVFLSARGFSTSSIGTLVATSSLVTIILQQVSGTFADSHDNIPLKYILALFMGVCVLAFTALMILPKSFMPTAVFYITAYSMQAAMAPIISSICLQFSNNNYSINFGFARALGSLGYSLAAFAMGSITDQFGSEIILPIYIAIYAVLLVLILFFFPIPERVNMYSDEAKAKQKKEESSTMKEFFSKYHRFLTLLLAIIFMWFGNCVMSTYMIYFIKDLGGTNADMGLTLSVMAIAEIPAVMFGVNIMKALGAGRMLRIATIGGIVRAVLYFLAPNVFCFTWLNVVNFFMSGFYQVSVIYYANSIVGFKDAVKAQSYLGIAGSGVCAMLASFIGGFMISAIPLKMILLINCVLSTIAFFIMRIATDPNRFPNEPIRRV